MTRMIVCCSCEEYGDHAEICGSLEKPCECDCHKAEAGVMLSKRVYDQMIRCLEPFAHQARIIDENDKADNYPREDCFFLFRFRGSRTAICLGDCRRAAEAIQAAQEDTK
jgi:hypothetical protein